MYDLHVYIYIYTHTHTNVTYNHRGTRRAKTTVFLYVLPRIYLLYFFFEEEERIF